MSDRKSRGVWFWAPIVLLVANAAYLSYFWVWRKDFYFPERYEAAFAASVPALAVGFIGVIWLIVAVVGSLRAKGA